MALLAFWLQYKDPHPRLPWLVLACLLGAGLALVQLAAGILSFHSDALLAAAYWLLLGAAVLAGRHIAGRNPVFSTELAMQPFWLAWVLAGIVSCAMALHQWLDLGYFGLFIEALPPLGRPYANMAQPNHLATLLLLALTGALFLFETGKIGALGCCTLVLLFCQGLAMTQSRSVLVGLFLAASLLFLKRPRYQLRMPAWGFAAVFAVYIAFSLAWPLVNAALLLQDDAQSAFTRSTTPGVRLVIWQSALDAIALRPWAGWGFGQIAAAQQATALDYPATHLFLSSAHNIALDLVLWMGIPAALVFCALLALQLRDGRAANRGAASSWAAWTGLACITGHALVELPLLYSYFLIPAGFLLGSQAAGTGGLALPGKALTLQRALLAAVALSGLIFLARLVPEYFSWEGDSRNLQFELQKFVVSEPAYAPEITLLDQIAAMHRAGRYRPAPGIAAGDLELLRRNAARYPGSVALLRYAYAAALNGQPQQAHHTLRLLCSLHTEALCAAARREWQQAGEDQWPQLLRAGFPQPAEYDRK